MPVQIFIVEDDDDVRETLVDVLAAHGLVSQTATNARDALEQIRRHALSPALFLIDLHMPEMDGRAFLHAQLADPLLRSIPVIMLTGAHVEPLPPPVVATLRKPVSLSELLKAVDGALAGGASGGASHAVPAGRQTSR